MLLVDSDYYSKLCKTHQIKKKDVNEKIYARLNEIGMLAVSNDEKHLKGKKAMQYNEKKINAINEVLIEVFPEISLNTFWIQYDQPKGYARNIKSIIFVSVFTSCTPYTSLSKLDELFVYSLVILDFEGMVLERMQLRQRDFPYFFQLGILAAFFGGKQVIVWSQLYFFRAAFQASIPPSSDFCTSRPPCHWGHGQRYSCPRH